MTAARTYNLYVTEFTVDAGPVRLYGVRPRSVLKGILVDYRDENGQVIEVGTFDNTTTDEAGADAACKAAVQAAAAHYLANRPQGLGYAVSDNIANGSILARANKMTEAACREMSRNDNS